MKKPLSLFSFLFLFLAATAQKVVNDPHAEVRPVSSFHAVHISDAFDVILTQGGEESVAVSAGQPEHLKHIIVKVEDGRLRIDYKDDRKWGKDRKLRAYISVKNIDELRVSGASDVKIEGRLTASSLKLHFAGASDLKGELSVSGPLGIHLSGASDIEISGSSDVMTIDVNGASDVMAFDFTTNRCDVEASGASTVRVTVDEELSARLNGASTVNYRGKGVIRDIKTSGASSIRKS